MEPLRIHPATPEPGVQDPAAVEVLLVDARGAEDLVRLAVEPAEIVPAGTERPGDAVPGGISVVVGVGGGDQRKLELPRGLDPGDAEGELGGDVYDVRAKACQVLDHVAHAGERPLDVRIEKQRYARRAVDLGAVGLTGREGVGRRVHADLVSARLKRLREAQQGDANPAHHGPVHFGEEGYAHVP
jgi:hypothetical protein